MRTYRRRGARKYSSARLTAATPRPPRTKLSKRSTRSNGSGGAELYFCIARERGTWNRNLEPTGSHNASLRQRCERRRSVVDRRKSTSSGERRSVKVASRTQISHHKRLGLVFAFRSSFLFFISCSSRSNAARSAATTFPSYRLRSGDEAHGRGRAERATPPQGCPPEARRTPYRSASPVSGGPERVNGAYVDTSCLVTIAFAEPRAYPAFAVRATAASCCGSWVERFIPALRLYQRLGAERFQILEE